MKNILIVGGGPRALAVALYASQFSSIHTTIFDSSPLSSWLAPNIIPDIAMRSPLSFDLTTFIPQLVKYSLIQYMGMPALTKVDQYYIEAYPHYPNRTTFYNYLIEIMSQLKDKGTCTWVKSNVKEIGDNYVITEVDEIFPGEAIVYAGGNKYSKHKVPNWIKQSLLKDKVLPLKEIIDQDNKGSFVVVGSGQGAAEITHYLAAQELEVYWCVNKEPKVTQYPAPAFTEWGYKSALGNYFRSIPTVLRPNYIKEVKAWQPSITPYISNKLAQVKFTKFNPTSTKDIETIFNKVEHVVLASGTEPQVNLIPFNPNVNIQVNGAMPTFPKLTKGFRSVSTPSIYFTGVFAAPYDGPRQASIISAALTAKEIVETLL